jgi:hypothetical protein
MVLLKLVLTCKPESLSSLKNTWLSKSVISMSLQLHILFSFRPSKTCLITKGVLLTLSSKSTTRVLTNFLKRRKKSVHFRLSWRISFQVSHRPRKKQLKRLLLSKPRRRKSKKRLSWSRLKKQLLKKRSKMLIPSKKIANTN